MFRQSNRRRLGNELLNMEKKMSKPLLSIEAFALNSTYLLNIFTSFNSSRFTTRPHFEHAKTSPELSIGRNTCSHSSELNSSFSSSCANGSKSNDFRYFLPFIYFVISSKRYIITIQNCQEAFLAKILPQFHHLFPR